MSLRDSRSPDKTLGQKSLSRKTSEPTLSCIPLNEKVMPDDQERRASLAFHGLRSFRCLSQDLITALEALLSTEPNFLRLHKTLPNILKTVSSKRLQRYILRRFTCLGYLLNILWDKKLNSLNAGCWKC
ncbi:hypothetical protein PSHT_09775 [Puccinia striiformis]|uniref:Uncharacterized protein n=1 Tax=Puccinia striiformis TaxID=27350 RepID=A0A2S4VE53_9BASI|nr:hypothetical protein PSHT_09775 [Puccinia striiformis]